ncbi:MAG: hypothetical protein QOE33_2317 [Acidobacteriota bacterium]|nr:hypothetical protein [Acidobacteriota bacterium]
MNITRRSFLRAGSVSALLAGLNLSPARLVFGQQKGGAQGKGPFAIPYEAKIDPAFYFTRDTFAPYLNSTFRISRGKGIAFDATLVEVFDFQAKARATKALSHEGECFALSFRTGERDTVSQGTFKFVHPALGRFSLFIVPGTSSAEGMTYGAVINHLA